MTLPTKATTQFPPYRMSVTDDPRSGNAVSADRTQIGVPLGNVVFDDLGTPENADADALIDAATSTELPNAGTITYTFPGSASPVDGANADGVLDVPRNITAAASHASSVVAMTILVSGYDQYGVAMTEQLSIAATGTSQAAAGKKAFKRLVSIAITSAGDATANTLDVGFGNVLGLSARVAPGGFLQGTLSGVKEATQGTFVNADGTSPATSTTGDVRGTYTPNGTLNGSNAVGAYYIAKNGPTDADGFGVAQA
jgi:hypothetical protein